MPHVFFSELETENGVPEDFAVVLKEMMSGKTGNYTITDNARVAFLHKGNLVWRRVKSVQYFFTNIAGNLFVLSGALLLHCRSHLNRLDFVVVATCL